MKRKRPYADMLHVAENIQAWLAPYCERIEIAGSLRRKNATVGDIELVAVPRYTTITKDLFGDVIQKVSLLDEHFTERGVKLTLNGDRYKQFLHQPLLPVKMGDVQVDLFLADDVNWGYIYMLRTGSATFTRLMVTPKSLKGFKPNHLWLNEGYVYESAIKPPVPLPTEEALFALWGMPVMPPEDRE